MERKISTMSLEPHCDNCTKCLVSTQFKILSISTVQDFYFCNYHCAKEWIQNNIAGGTSPR